MIAGCGVETTTTISAPAPAEPKGQVVSGVDYSIEVPKNWLVLDPKTMSAEAMKKKLKGTQFEPRAANVDQIRSNEMVKMMAYIPELTVGTEHANLNVLVIPGAPDTKTVLEANEKGMKEVAKSCEVLKDFTKIAESRSFISEMYGMKMVTLVSVQKGKQFVLTLTVSRKTDNTKAQAAALPVFNSFVAK